MKSPAFRPRHAAVLTFAAFIPAPLYALERYWINNAGSDQFSTTTNWSAASGGATGASVPVGADTANFDDTGAYTVNFASLSHTNNLLDIEGGNVTFDLSGGSYTLNFGVRIGNLLGSTAACRLTLFDGTLDVDSNGDNLEVGTGGADGFLTVSTGAIIGAGGTNPDILLGMDADATLTINNGGIVNSATASFGFGSPVSTGTATVTGLGSQWINAGAFIVGQSGIGTLTVQSGATISGNGSQIGGSNSSIGSASITGAGSTWTEAGNITVGNFGTGSLTISSGATMPVAGSAVVAAGGPGFGTVSVSGAGSSWSLGTDLTVGGSGQGTLSISSAGKVNCAALTVGDVTTAGTEGAVTITGADSKLTANGVAQIGDEDIGSLTVSNGGVLVTKAGTGVGNAAAGAGEITVIGAHADWMNTGTINLAGSGAGTLAVSNGGTVISTGALNINDPAGSQVGTLIFDGGLIVVPSLTRAAGGVFNWTDGTLRIVDGTFNNAGANLTINGAEAGDLPALELMATAGVTNFGPTLTVGANHAGALAVTGGSSLSVTDLFIGTMDGGAGTVTVRGEASFLEVGDDLVVGGNEAGGGGAGTLNIESGASAGVSELRIRSGGTVNLNGAGLNLQSISNVSGQFHFNSGQVNFLGGDYSGNLSSVYDTLLGPGHRLLPGQDFAYEGSASFTDTSLIIDGGRYGVNETLTVGANSLLEMRGGRISANALITNSQALVLLEAGQMTLATTMTNAGELRLDTTTDSTVLSGSILTNTGLIRGNGQINMSVTNNTGGRIRVAAGDLLVLNGAASNNGTGIVEVAADGDLQLAQTFNNSGVVNVSGGVLRVDGLATNAASTGMIGARDAILWLDGGLTNSGSLAFGAGVNDIFGEITNTSSGRIVVSGGAATIFYDDITSNGSIQVSTAGSLASSAVFFGALLGNGVAGGGHVFLEGDARPGFSPGVMAFGGHVSFGPFSRLNVELGGAAPGTQYDRVTVAGHASLDGSLEVTLINGFSPAAGQSFDIFDAGSRSGTFASVSLPALPAGLFWRTDRLYGEGVIEVSQHPGSFEEFARFHRLDGGVTGDDDGDGLTNYLEYITGQNPRSGVLAGGPLSTLNGNTLTFTFTAPASPGMDAVYVIETSPNLMTWTTRATRTGAGPWSGPDAAGIAVTSAAGGLENVTLTLTPGADRRLFIRLRGQPGP